MKKLVLASALLAATLSSCNDEVDSVTQHAAAANELEVKAFVEGANNSRVGWTGEKSAFSQGEKLGLYVYQGTWSTNYNGARPNEESTLGAEGWVQTQPINMTADKAQVWAYYPWHSSNGNGEKIAVDLSTGADYMFGTTGAPASVSTANPVANIQMKHALTQLVLRLQKSPEYKDEGILTNITLESSTSNLATKGTMDVRDGKITGNPMTTKIVFENLSEQFPKGSEPVDYKAILFPMESTGSLTLKVTIDRVEYSYKIPTTKWDRAKRNIYSIQLTSNGIQIGGENGSGITVEQWTNGSSTDVTLKPVVK